MESAARLDGPTEVFDSFDVDLLIKVLRQTVFGPFFVFFVPLFFKFQGLEWTDPPVLIGFAYFAVLSCFWSILWLSRLYRNGGNIFFAPPKLDWGEQIVVITGGSSGIGELIANTLAVRNVTVIVLDVKPIETENYNITYYKCDVSNWEEVQAVQKQIVEEIGHPTILINNAGVVQGKLLLDLTPEDVKQTFNVNTIGNFWTLKAFLPEMIKNGTGHIVTVSSAVGLTGVAQMTDYTASKAALVALNDSLRYELDKRYKTPKIRTTLVFPGHVFTPLFANVKYPNGWINKFFTPSIPPYVVAKAVITVLDQQDSSNIYLPFYTHFIRWVVLSPSFVRDFFQWLSGADYAMEGFRKTTGLRSEEDAPVPSKSG